jgi:hypothetical protein
VEERRRRQATILVVGTDDLAITAGSAGVDATGSRVLTCHAEGEPSFPCNAFIDGRRCPVDVGFDFVINVRAAGQPIVTPSELGALCALRAGKRVVVTGARDPNPFAGVAGVEGDFGPTSGTATTIDLDIRAANDLRRW